VTPAEKFGKAVASMSTETLKQVQSAGQTLAANGVKHNEALGQTTPAPTPAQKFGHPAGNQVLKSQQVQGERGHALTPDSNIGQKPPTQGRSL